MSDPKKPLSVDENRETEVLYTQGYLALWIAEDVGARADRGEPFGERLNELIKVLRESHHPAPMQEPTRIHALTFAERIRLMRTSHDITNRFIKSLIKILDGDF